MEPSENQPPAASNFPKLVVGIGASAGGLEALERFFKAMPSDTGLAFVVVQHLSPDFKSVMDELLARHTTMAIVRVADPTSLAANTIYLMPPRKEILLQGGQLVLVDRATDQPLSMPITRFFRSLAQEVGERAVGIVLSGTGSDGSLGVVDIHDAGGLVLVQTEQSAKFDGMPRSAIATGFANAILEPEAMAAALIQQSQGSAPHPRPVLANLERVEPGHGLAFVFERLRETYGIDFNQYKPATIGRRIERRMNLANLAKLEDYCQLLANDTQELDALYRDLLIGVTHFFRDTEAFETLRTTALPELLRSLPPNDDLRVWVPGCATGEEAYSLGILLLQELDRQGRTNRLKMFASDVHRDSLRVAAEGAYPETSLESLPAEIRTDFFTPEADGRWRVSARLRKSILFSPQNLLKDVPFNRIDLVSCRNLLIYFQPPAQNRALAAFHFALKRNGILFLGPSESLGEIERDFAVLDRPWRIFRKLSDHRLPLDLQSRTPGTIPPVPRPLASSDPRLMRVYGQLLDRFLPPAVLINDRREAVHIFAGATRFLRLNSGRVDADVISLCEGDLRVALSSAIQAALKRDERVILRRVPVGAGENRTVVDVAAEPVMDRTTQAIFVLVQFLEQPTPSREAPARERPIELGTEVLDRVEHLEAELQGTRESLQTMVEELETTNEELQSSNEELLSSNEELQSTNEELHSVNEELYTINAEHEEKIRELAATTTDLRNLMSVTHAGIIFTDADFRIRLFTPGAAQLLNLLPQDIGRPLDHITSRTNEDDLLPALLQVRQTKEAQEKPVHTVDGRHFLRRITSYEDSDRRQVGLVVAFVEISELIRAQEAVRESEERFRVMIEGTPSALLMVDQQGTITHANPQAARTFGYERDELLGQPLDILLPTGTQHSHRDMFRMFFHNPTPRPMGRGRDLWGRRKDGSDIPLEIGLSPVRIQGKPYVLAFMTDITARKQAEQALVESESRFRQMANDAPVMIWLAAPNGSQTFFNQTWLRLTGRPLERECGDGWIEGLHPDDREPFLRIYRDSIQHQRAFDIEHRLRRADGAYAWIYTQATPRHGPEGTFLGLIGCCTDVTQQKRFAEEQKRIEDKIQETAKLESLGVLAGGIAHDFNNILAGILGNVSLAQMDLPDDSPLQETLTAVHNASIRARDLCKQMLAYSGRSRFVLKRVELGWLVRDTSKLIQASINKNVRLELELAEKLPPVDMDVSQIQQVIMNLVINASEAIGDRPGLIRIRTGLNPRTIVATGTEIVSPHRPAHEYVYLEVADDGCGISAENLRRIFDPFYTTKFTGRGLGLAAVQGIVRGHKGALFVRSTEGSGTTFRLLLPWSDEAPARTEGPAAAFELTAGFGSILVVDDEEVVRSTVSRILQRFGYQCVQAADGIDAIKHFAAAPRDFRGVVLDLTMPGMDGARTYTELRKLNPNVRVLLISGFSESDATSRFTDGPPHGFLQKPIGAEELVVALQSILK